MSEYQYYEFLALDRPLTAEQRTELRAISSRAEITATRHDWDELDGRLAVMAQPGPSSPPGTGGCCTWPAWLTAQAAG